MHYITFPPPGDATLPVELSQMEVRLVDVRRACPAVRKIDGTRCFMNIDDTATTSFVIEL